jgi:hypothetical protein
MNLEQGNLEMKFFAANGAVLHDAYELLEELKSMDDGTFHHHVNQERNDFSNWIRDVYRNKRLAAQIGRCKSKDEMIAALEKTAGSDLKSEVSQEFYFYLKGERVVRSAAEMLSALKEMDDETFKYHANSERNDFSNWFRDVYNKKDLASKLKKCKSKGSMTKCLEKALRGI